MRWKRQPVQRGQRGRGKPYIGSPGMCWGYGQHGHKKIVCPTNSWQQATSGEKGGELAAAHPRSITGPSKPLGRSKSRILGVPRESYTGESASKLTIKADQEPILQIEIEGKTTPMMVDTGAVYTCVNSNYASDLSLSGKFAKTIGFSGQMQQIPMTAPVCLQTKKKVQQCPFLCQIRLLLIC